MKPAPFLYCAPRTVAEAIASLASLDDTKPLAGGQSLVPMMNMRFVSPAQVVDLNRIDELAGIAQVGERLEIGAMVRQARLLSEPQVAALCPLLGEGLSHVGHMQTRSRGTIGGSLCHLDPAAELPVVASALDARLVLQGPQGRREVAFADWPLGYMTPDLGPAELLVQVSLPTLQPRQGQAFVEFARRHGDFAVACVAAVLTLDETGRISSAAIAVGGVCATVTRLARTEALLLGQPASDTRLALAAREALSLESADDAYYSADFRRALTQTLVARALARAAQRANATPEP